MSMEDKVDREQTWDISVNRGRLMKSMTGIVLRHGDDLHDGYQFSREEMMEAGKVLDAHGINPAEARIVEWLSRAAASLLSVPLDERRRLAWEGSDSVTDIGTRRPGETT